MCPQEKDIRKARNIKTRNFQQDTWDNDTVVQNIYSLLKALKTSGSKLSLNLIFLGPWDHVWKMSGLPRSWWKLRKIFVELKAQKIRFNNKGYNPRAGNIFFKERSLPQWPSINHYRQACITFSVSILHLSHPGSHTMNKSGIYRNPPIQAFHTINDQ